MNEMHAPIAGRREFLKAAGATGTALLVPAHSAWAADPINLFTWSAAVDQVKSHIARLRTEDRPEGELQQRPVGAVPRHDGHQVRRQRADRHDVGVRFVAARVG